MTTTPRSPVEVDTELAELYGQGAALEHAADSLFARAHRRLNETKIYYGRSKQGRWPTTDTQAWEKFLAKATAGELKPWDQTTADEDIAKMTDVVARQAAHRARTIEVSAEYTGWSRFFEVTSSNGHIHESTACSTCYPRTQFGWHPQLSGLTEADAVAKLGPILCSVCFPSAPVAWKRDRADVKREEQKASGLYCDGQGSYGKNIQWRYSPWGTCPVCETNQSVTSTGKVRKHKIKVGG